MRPSSSLAWLALVIVACSPSAPDEPLAPGTEGAGKVHPIIIPRPPPLRPPPPPPGDMPDPDACSADADCRVIVSGADPAHPCCDRTFTMRPTSIAYLRWAETYQRDECGSVHCDPLMFPGAEGAECTMQARCRDSRCTNACPATPAPTLPRPPSPAHS